MTKRIKIMSVKLVKGEKGQILILVLILMLLGGLLTAPLLAYMATGYKTTRQVYEVKTEELYAADSGIEDALWQIKYDQLGTLFANPPYTPSYTAYDYETDNWTYSLSEQINGKDVNVTIKNDWIPKDIDVPDVDEARNIIEAGKLMIIGGNPAESTYQIKMIYYYGAEGPNALTVDKIGIWLPPGFDYNDNCNLTAVPPDNSPYKSGKAVVWTFSPAIKFSGLPSIGGTFILPDIDDTFTINGGPIADSGTITATAGDISVSTGGGASCGGGNWETPASSGTIVVKATRTNTTVTWTSTKASATAVITSDNDGDATTDYPLVRSFTFKFTGPAKQNPGVAVSWIDTSGVPDIPFAWDANTKIYQISSVAGSTKVETYTAKSEFRKLGSAMEGDYTATGGTLMIATANAGENSKYRDRLFMGSSGIIQSDDSNKVSYIPEHEGGFKLEAAYLYWSGWIDYHYAEQYGPGRWRWGEIPELKYPDSPTSNELTRLVETNAKVNRVKLNDIELIATNSPYSGWQVQENSHSAADTWSYSCFYDLTYKPSEKELSVFEQLVENGDINENGVGKYTLEHSNSVVNVLRLGYDTYNFDLDGSNNKTGYPLATPAHRLPGSGYETRYQWSYAGWSLVLIYSSAETKGHQLYLFDTFHYIGLDTTLRFDISGFLAPSDTTGSHLTYFVGEGDNHYEGEYIALNAPSLPAPDAYKLNDSDNPRNNPFNSVSNTIGATHKKSGIDIDTFDMSSYINPDDTTAKIVLDNGEEIYNLVYIILSFRSLITSGGRMTYEIRN